MIILVYLLSGFLIQVIHYGINISKTVHLLRVHVRIQMTE